MAENGVSLKKMSENERDASLALAATGSMFLFMAAILKTKKKKRKRSIWVKKMLREREKGQFAQLVSHLQLNNENDYRRYMRMDFEQFQVSKIKSILLLFRSI